jgi:hypothetical protein
VGAQGSVHCGCAYAYLARVSAAFSLSEPLLLLLVFLCAPLSRVGCAAAAAALVRRYGSAASAAALVGLSAALVIAFLTLTLCAATAAGNAAVYFALGLAFCAYGGSWSLVGAHLRLHLDEVRRIALAASVCCTALQHVALRCNTLRLTVLCCNRMCCVATCCALLQQARVGAAAALIAAATAIATLFFTSALFAPTADVRHAARPADFVRPWLTALLSSAATVPPLVVALCREIRAGGSTGQQLLAQVRSAQR